jgi:class 3 adenylate cyclase
VLAAAGKAEAAQGELKALAALIPAGAGLAAVGHWTLYAASDQLLEALGAEGLRTVYDRWSHVEEHRLHVPGWPLDLIWGLVALELGLVDEAERHLRRSLAWCEQERWPVEQGRCLAGLAQVAERRGNAAEALRLLDEAAAPFRQHGAKLYLDRAIAAKVRLQGIGSTESGRSIDAVLASVQTERPDLAPVAAPGGIMAIMFGDIEDSTPLNQRIGDQRYAALLREYAALVRGEVERRRGHVVKSIGDGFMAAFTRPEDAVSGAVGIQEAVSRAAFAEPLRVRIGLHAGTPVREGADFFGVDVTVASRITNLAQGGEIVVSSALRDAAGAMPGVAFDGAREVELKGLEGRHTVYGAKATR